MNMKQMFTKIKILPLENTLIHEGTVKRWVEKVAEYIQHDGFIKHPVVVTENSGKYIVLDGMHRVAALKELGVRDIAAYIVDYDKNVKLYGWDGLILSPISIHDSLEHFKNGRDFKIIRISSYEEARKLLALRNIYFFMMGKKEIIDAVAPPDASTHIELEEWISCFRSMEEKLDEAGHKIIYIADSQSLQDFRDSNAHVLFGRPSFTKAEVLKRTLQSKIFPRKSTRHVIPGRPLRVDVDLTLLREHIDIETKNQLLQSRLKWAWENNMVRYYPDSVFVFSD